MNCAICYSPITPETGKLELSCSHSFHINCLALWFETLNRSQRAQECPYCRHECIDLEIIPIATDIYYGLYRELSDINNAIELELHEEIRILSESLRIATERANIAEEKIKEAVKIARDAYHELHQYKLEQRTRDVVIYKQQLKDNWSENRLV